ncbi:hypothetical protein ACIQU6_38500 [Streptomyces sp. NPDC090442]|uniref:hypothetical protein n=1 Tax=Streptomyces sp. NPDC090442 TaxID=3365962 RepID=UPI00381D9ED7
MLPIIGILTTVMVLAPAAAADGKDTYKPGGIGDLMPSPIKPPGQGTLFESYDPGVYQLDKQLSDNVLSGDLVDSTLHGVASMLMAILTLIGRAAVVVVQWCFNVVSLPEVEPAISKAIGAAAGPMATMFLPAAVAVGGLIAWAKRSQTSPLGQIAWVAASAAIATTFFTAPNTWVETVDKTRQAGASVAMTTINGGLSGKYETAVPFKTPEPQWSGKDKDDTIRKASDAVWRTYVATPWCVADLGSINACQKWGAELLDHGSDMDEREDFLKDNLTEDTLGKGTVGKDAVAWRQGHNPGGRIGVLVLAIVSAGIFSALVILLAITTLASLLGTLMLLVCGVIFACLWCIPGRTRQWGTSWFEALIGLTVVSFTSTMLLGSVMVVSTALLKLLGTYGWLMVSALNIATAAMAFKLKGKLDGIVSAGGAQLAGRGVLNTVGRMATMRRLNRMANAGGRSTPGRGTPPSGKPNTSTPGGTGRRPQNTGTTPIRVGRTRSYPPPPTYPQPSNQPRLTAGPYGDYAATRPGLPPGSGGPQGTAATRTAKAELARTKATYRPALPARGPGMPGQRPGQRPPLPPGHRSGATYPVRPGEPRRPTIPDQPARPSGSGKVIQGTVVGKPANPVGAKFRSYPPPPSPQRAAGTAANAAARAATGKPLAPLPPGTRRPS